jgi:hypothetical protein
MAYGSDTRRFNAAGKMIGSRAHHDKIWINYKTITKKTATKKARQDEKDELEFALANA